MFTLTCKAGCGANEPILFQSAPCFNCGNEAAAAPAPIAPNALTAGDPNDPLTAGDPNDPLTAGP